MLLVEVRQPMVPSPHHDWCTGVEVEQEKEPDDGAKDGEQKQRNKRLVPRQVADRDKPISLVRQRLLSVQQGILTAHFEQSAPGTGWLLDFGRRFAGYLTVNPLIGPLQPVTQAGGRFPTENFSD